MRDRECVALLQWALPRLGLRWQGFRRVRGQVCKRIRRRVAELDLPDATAYRARLEADASEWEVLRTLCVVTISRFHRDRGMWEALRTEVLPAAADLATETRDDALRCWHIGCASAEEPYTLAILWTIALANAYPHLRLRILGTDIDERVLERARIARYSRGTLRELPSAWIAEAFQADGDLLVLRERFRAPVELRREDIRATLPDETFQIVLCRNVVCTYFDEAVQQQTLERILTRLAPGGAFVIGRHEHLPSGIALEPWLPALGIHRKR